MAKTSVIMRNLKRIRICETHRASRAVLKEVIRKNEEGAEKAMLKLQSFPRDASLSRLRNRCGLCGRSCGNYKKFGLCRIHLREAAMKGDVPGLRKTG